MKVTLDDIEPGDTVVAYVYLSFEREDRCLTVTSYRVLGAVGSGKSAVGAFSHQMGVCNNAKSVH